MRQAVLTLLCALLSGAISLFAQTPPTIDGTATPAEYQVSVTNSNPISNNGFGPESDIGAIRTWTDGTNLYIGVPAKVQTNGNQLAIWMDFSEVAGRPAGTKLSCAFGTGTYLDSTWVDNNNQPAADYRADFEVDYMLSVNTQSGAVWIAKTGGTPASQNLGTATTTASSNSGGSVLTAGAATFALDNQTANDIRTTNTGFEIRFTLSALGATSAGTVRLFAIIVGATNPFFSNVLVPGTAGVNNLGFDPNLASPPTGYTGPFNTSPISLPVELTSFTAQTTSEGVRLSWTTASELNNSGFEVQRSTNQTNWATLGFVRGAGTTTEAQSYSFVDASASGRVFYRLKQVDFDGQFEYSNIIEVNAGVPQTFALEQNYPNPFNPSTAISYQLPVAGNVSLKVFDMLGKEVATLVNARQEAGAYTVNFNANNLSSGVYFYRLQAGNFVQTRKMMLVK